MSLYKNDSSGIAFCISTSYTKNTKMSLNVMSNQPTQPIKPQTVKSILCNECKNEFKKEGAKVDDKVQCPTCGTTLTMVSVDEKGTGKTRPVPEEK